MVGRQTLRQTDRQTGRQTDRQTDRGFQKQRGITYLAAMTAPNIIKNTVSCTKRVAWTLHKTSDKTCTEPGVSMDAAQNIRQNMYRARGEHGRCTKHQTRHVQGQG